MSSATTLLSDLISSFTALEVGKSRSAIEEE